MPDSTAYAGNSTPPLSILEQRFAVRYEYPIVFTTGVFREGNSALHSVLSRFPTVRGAHSALAILDAGLVQHWPALASDVIRSASYGAPFRLVAEPWVIPGGEACKNDPELLQLLYARFSELGLDRHSFILAVGGGAMLDLVGYAASTTHRGVRLVRIPTTVLSQNDGGVGVKNGVNAFHSKNFLGSFCPPVAVVNDFDFLRTLSARDRRAGMAEAVKVAVLKDPKFFAELERDAARLSSGEASAVAHLVTHTARLHADHIAQSGDPFEWGSARPLDYGHWSAHKLESLTENQLRHGEAVAIGIAIDAKYSELTGMLPGSDCSRILQLLERLGLATYHPALSLTDDAGRLLVLNGLEEFRQHLGGDLTVPQLEGLGRLRLVHEIDPERMTTAIDWLRAKAIP